MELKKFIGLCNTTSPERFKPGGLAVALDVDIDNSARLMSRRGKTVINATASHSLYSHEGASFLSQGNTIYGINQDLSLTVAKVLTSALDISYDSLNGVAYYSNGTDTGRFVGRTPKAWGIAIPTGQPSASATSGNLRPGRYQYAMTFIRSDGNESGTGLSGQIDLAVTGGIRLGNIPVSTDPDVMLNGIYISTRDGEVLYRAAVIPNPQTVAFVSDESNTGIPLLTQFAGPAPAGSLVHIFNGIAYVVSGNVVYYSDPYNLELFRPGTNFMQFPGNIGIFAGVNDGIYVATSDSEGDGTEGNMGSTWFLSGTRPDQMKSKFVFDYGATPGTAAFVNDEYFGEQVERIGEPVLVWTSRHGVCVGGDGGNAHNLTETMYSFPSAQDGAALVRHYRGFVQYMVAQRGTGASNNAYQETI